MKGFIAAAVLLFVAASTIAAPAATPRPLRFFAGSDKGIGPQVARDIGRLVARPAGIDLRPQATAGSVETLQRLRLDGSGVSLALLPSDTAAAYLGAGGSPDAVQMLASLRVVAPLHDEEIYFIVRSDSPLTAVHEIKDLRISVGPAKSSDSATLTTLYRVLFGEPAAEDKLSFLDREEALIKLITDRTVDVVAFVAAQPDRLLAEMKPEARRFVKLLRFDPAFPRSAEALKIYTAAAVRAASYPNLLGEDLPALSLKTFLVSHGHRSAENDALLGRFAASWCQHLPRLAADAHPALKGLLPGLPELPPGWNYSPVAAREIARCAGVAAPVADTCGAQERILGLCE